MAVRGGNNSTGSGVCWSSKEVRSGVGEVKRLGSSSATVSMDEYPAKERWATLAM